MAYYIGIGSCIGKCAKLRGLTIKEVAEEMNINYKTFQRKLKKDTLSAYEFLKLVDIFKIDFEGMKLIMSNPLLTRMSSKERSAKRIELQEHITNLIENECYDVNNSNALTSKLKVKFSKPQILDIVLPDYCEILMTADNKNTLVIYPYPGSQPSTYIETSPSRYPVIYPYPDSKQLANRVPRSNSYPGGILHCPGSKLCEPDSSSHGKYPLLEGEIILKQFLIQEIKQIKK